MSALENVDPKTYKRIAEATPVHDDDAERLLIGGMLKFPERFVDVVDLVTPDMFYSPQHTAIWEAMLFLNEDARPIDIVSVGERLAELKADKVKPYLLHELHNESLTAASAAIWAERIVRTWRVRTVFYAAGHIVGLALNPGADPEDLLERLAAIEEKLESRKPSVARTAGDVALQVLRELAELKKSGVAAGQSTGLVDFDHHTGGFRDSDLIVLAARPAMGKTAFAGNVAAHVAKSRPVLFVSIEMSDKDIIQRLMSSLGKVNSIRIRDALVSEDETERLQGARVQLGNTKLWIADLPGATVGQIAGLARRVKHKCGDLGLIVVDYMQLVTHHGRDISRQEQVSEISRRLKLLARQLNCPVLALSQLSRKCEERNDKRPLLSDLRESGAIEQDADVVAFIYRHEVYYANQDQGKAELIIGKARKGVTGTVKLVFDRETTTFRSAAAEWHSGDGFPVGGY